MAQIREIQGLITITFAASPAVMAMDCSQGNVFQLSTAVTANMVFAVTNLKPGQRCYLDVTQDGAGAHTISFGGAGGMTVTGPVGAAINAGAGTRTIFELLGISQGGPGTPGAAAIVNAQQ